MATCPDCLVNTELLAILCSAASVAHYPSCMKTVAQEPLVHVHNSWLWGAGFARVGSSKHSPGRRITFPSILPLFTPPSQPRPSPLEPVKEGEQLSSKPALPSKHLYPQAPVLVLLLAPS